MNTLLEKVLGSNVAEPLVASSATYRKVCQVFVQVKRSNSHSMEWGIESFVAGKGIELLAPEDDVTLPSFSLPQNQNSGNNVDLSKIYILGTSGEGVNIIIEEY